MMGYFSNLAIDIEEAMASGATVAKVAEHFGISEAEVRAVIAQSEDADRDPVPQD